MTSRLREDAARFLRALGLDVEGHQIQCVSGYWRRQDCYRFEFFCRKTKTPYGCWLPLGQFVRECKKYGGASFGGDGWEVYPAYPPTEDDYYYPN